MKSAKHNGRNLRRGLASGGVSTHIDIAHCNRRHDCRLLMMDLRSGERNERIARGFVVEPSGWSKLDLKVAVSKWVRKNLGTRVAQFGH